MGKPAANASPCTEPSGARTSAEAGQDIAVCDLSIVSCASSTNARAVMIDRVAVERPLEVRVQGVLLCVTMRTPGHDAELARGLLLSERVVQASSIVRVVRCEALAHTPRYDDLIDVRLKHDAVVDPAAFRRMQQVSSSCGVCGSAAVDRLVEGVPAVQPTRSFTASTLAGLPERMAQEQPLFDATGGTHAAALFDADDARVVVREDVGRHNAVDKVFGFAAATARAPLMNHVLCVSGRVSFDIAQKALVAGVSAIVAVSAPSSLAVELCARTGILLARATRAGKLQVYANAQRLGAP